MAAKMAAGVAAAVAVTAVAAGDRRNGTVAAVAAVPERGVLQRRARGHGGAGVDGGARASGGGDGEGCDDWHGGGDDGSENGGGGGRLGCGGGLARRQVSAEAPAGLTQRFSMISHHTG